MCEIPITRYYVWRLLRAFLLFGLLVKTCLLVAHAKELNSLNPSDKFAEGLMHAGELAVQEKFSPSNKLSVSNDSVSNESVSNEEKLKLLADIRVHTTEELENVLDRVDELFVSGGISANDEPVVFLLHGDEARVLYQQNYSKNKKVVDLAARLSAFDVVDIRVCEAWSGSHGMDNNELQPFVDTVPFAPAEEKALLKKGGYSYF